MKVMRTTVPVVFALAAAAGYAQTPRLEFEVSSVKPSPQTADPSVQVGLHIDGAQVHFNRISMKDCVRAAFALKLYQVTGPEWMAGERYDIDAKLPEGATRDQVAEMLKSLLIDRFHLKTHTEQREMPVYALVVLAGGSKMKEVAASAETEGRFQVKAQGGPGGVNLSYGPDSTFKFGDNKIEGTKLSMANFVDVLGRFVDRPVLDVTQLPGRYDLLVQLSEDDYNAMLIRSAISAGVQLPPQALRYLDTADGSLFGALKPLGLKLESRKAPFEVLVVDSVSKTPTEN
jgi:uncharacterized protein (TIGR03435 family)